MKERIAIIDGYRTPQGRADGVLKDISADDLGAFIFRELMERVPLSNEEIDEVIIGNVAQPANAANIARVVALKAGLPERVPAYTVHRNCASGMESITTAASKLLTGEHTVVLAGGTESMSNIPFLFSKKMKTFFTELMKAKTPGQKLGVLARFRMGYLKPVIGVLEGLTDPVCGLVMGLTAENLSRDFNITRDDQDKYALESHQKAVKAQKDGKFTDEIIPIPLPPKYKTFQEHDEGPRANQSIEALAKLRPYFDRKAGTVTVGNACPINDGAAAVLLMTESEAKKRKLKPLGYMSAFAYAGLDPSRMGLGPYYATAKLLGAGKYSMSDFDLIELNEAFAAQVLANVKAFSDADYGKEKLGLDAPLGDIDIAKLNVNGGAIALGHPVGTSGTRIVITLLRELRRSGKQRGLATLCVGGGQGASLVLETE